MSAPTLATYTRIVADLGVHYAETIDAQRRNLELTCKNLRANLDQLERRTNHYIENYWVDLREWYSMPIHPHNSAYGHRRWDWHQYFRALASDLQRPYIRVVHSYYDQLPIVLCIPKRKSLLPLSSAFMLLDQAKQRHDTITWRWVLIKEQFDWWCEAITTDSEMRTALRTPLIPKPRNARSKHASLRDDASKENQHEVS